MNQELTVINTMNILKQLVSDINSNIPIKKEFEYVIEGSNELLDIYFNESNSIRLFYKNLNDKILLSRSILLLKNLILYIKENAPTNRIPENMNNTISAAIKISEEYYASNN